MLIPYFMVYLLHYFYSLKTKCERQNPIENLESTQKNVYLKNSNNEK